MLNHTVKYLYSTLMLLDSKWTKYKALSVNNPLKFCCVGFNNFCIFIKRNDEGFERRWTHIKWKYPFFNSYLCGCSFMMRFLKPQYIRVKIWLFSSLDDVEHYIVSSNFCK